MFIYKTDMNIFGTNVNKKGKREKNQNVKEGPCIFPFKHQWKEHNECIDNDDKATRGAPTRRGPP